MSLFPVKRLREVVVEVQQRVYDIDDLCLLVCQADNNDKRFELIDGELFEMSTSGRIAWTLDYSIRTIP